VLHRNLHNLRYSLAAVCALMFVVAGAGPQVETSLTVHQGDQILTEESPANETIDLADFASIPMSMGHPDIESLRAFVEISGPRGGDDNVPESLGPYDPPDSPLESGAFVNFESPPFKPLALNENGTLLFAVNTPNNSLVVYDTTTPRLTKVKEIPVGLDPVSLAVQPETNGNIVWVANFISDNVAVVDVAAGAVTAIVEVGDEPINILFNPSGSLAFVILQGSPTVADFGPNVPDPLVQEGAVVAVRGGAPHTILQSKYLDCNTPRSAVYDADRDRLIISPLHSGNSTTVVGEPVLFQLPAPLGGCCFEDGACQELNTFDCFDAGGSWQGGESTCDDADLCAGPFEPPANAPNDPCNCDCSCVSSPHLLALAFFDQTFEPTPAELFTASSLAPWPDIWTANPMGPAAPLVQRIVMDKSMTGGDWNAIIDALTDDNGDPHPQRVADLAAQFNLLNAEEVLQEIIDDAKAQVSRDVIVIDVNAAAGLTNMQELDALTVQHLGGTLTGMAQNPVTGDIFISNLEPRNLTRLEPSLNGNFMSHRIEIVRNIHGVATIVSADLHEAMGSSFNDITSVNPQAQDVSLANPTDIVFDDDGDIAFVAAFGVGRIGILNGATAEVIARVDVGRGPRGMAIDSARDRLYVLNRTDMTVSVVDVTDVAAPQVMQTTPMFNPEPPVVREGRDFLYSTRFSKNFSSSCAMCHFDGHLDHHAWDLGNPTEPDMLHSPFITGGEPCPPQTADQNHPLKGPMVTLSLRGLRNHTELHWRGDREDFNAFNPTFEGLLGGEELPVNDMQAFTDFINTVVYPPNPYRTRDNFFKDPQADAGRTLFMNSCHACHMLDHDGAMQLACVPDGDDVAFNLGGLFAQIQLVPQLRQLHKKARSDLYNGFGLLHDGREEREQNDHPLETFLQQFFPGISQQPFNEQIIGFLTAWQSNVMPVVGWQFVWDVAAPNSQDVTDLMTMIDQHDLQPSRCDVVLKGSVAGDMRGFVLAQAGPVLFESDEHQFFTLAQMQALVAAGNSLVATAVPPGSGYRIGVDQDLDGIGDGLDPMPQFNNDGDVNLDGTIDGLDIQAFVTVALDPNAAPIAAFHAADIDNDDDADVNDAAELVLLLLGSIN